MELSRRQLLTASLFLYGVLWAGPLKSLRAQPERRPTPEQVMGPFYPVIKPSDLDADLTVISGRPGKARGQVIYVSGLVLDLKDDPVAGARVEIWQANTYGRYRHPGDKNPASLDPDFEGYGVQITDAEGRYRFKTIKPGAYPATKEWTRPPHIHFIVTGKSNRLVTQMYFDGEPLNKTDMLLKDTPNKELLITKLTPPSKDMEPGALAALWDIVLP
ncbi:MAG: protocatechuate 3,4-dioxygenase [Nitrospirae bacterium]|nr:protocatechuate 3,4-dioxygenase [Nitrospirota bacterium]